MIVVSFRFVYWLQYIIINNYQYAMTRQYFSCPKSGCTNDKTKLWLVATETKATERNDVCSSQRLARLCSIVDTSSARRDSIKRLNCNKTQVSRRQLRVDSRRHASRLIISYDKSTDVMNICGLAAIFFQFCFTVDHA